MLIAVDRWRLRTAGNPQNSPVGSSLAGESVDPIASDLLEFIVMNTIRIVFASVLFTSVALATSAQSQSAAGASMPMGGNMMSHDCAKPMSSHNHGSERGTPRARTTAAPCMVDANASAPVEAASAPKKQLEHDHAKFNKNA